MEELKQLLEASGMSERDFCYALSQMSRRKGGVKLSLKTFEKMIDGLWTVPEGVISDAHQLLADIDYIQSVIDSNPQLKNISFKVWELLLDDTN